MSNKFVRSSKFRHIFGTASKKDNCYDNIRITKGPHESNMSAVNSKFLAVVLEGQGGGAFMVTPLSQTGRFDINYPKVSGHKSPVLDLAWNPFNDNQIASASEDCTVMIWDIPDEGIKSNLTEYVIELKRHQRKVVFVLWHPSASDVLLSASADNNIYVWNTKSGEALFSIEGKHPDMIQSVSWNYDGSFIATTCKDKKLRVIDPRSGEVCKEGNGHSGNKPSKVVFCGTTNKLFTTGFTRMSDRQYALWDCNDLSKSLTMQNIDTGSGVLFPFWDDGCKVVYVIGKGDTQIRYFEVTDNSPYVFFLSMYQGSKDPSRGACCMPKKEIEYMKCEVMRFYRLTQKSFVEPVAMTVPRKSDMFQDDIYPPCPAGKPSLTAEEWQGGTNKAPLLVKFSADGLSPMSEAESQSVYKPMSCSKDATPVAKKEPSVLKRLNSPPPDRPMPVSLDEYRIAYKELLDENKQLKEKIAKLEGK